MHPMRAVPVACAALLAAGASVAFGQNVPTYDPETFYDTTSIFGSSFSPDESKILITTDETGIFNAYSIPASGGKWTQLTDSTTNAVFAISYFPNDERFLFSSDEGGNELTHVYVQTPDGEVTDLTPGENVKAQFAGWSGDLSTFYIATNERDARFFDIYAYDASNYERSMLYQNDNGYQPGDISRDGKWLSLTMIRNNMDNNLYLVDLTSPGSEPVHVTPHEGDISYSSMTFTPDSSTLYYGSNEGSEYTRVWAYNLATGEREMLMERDWDIMYVGFSFDGKYRVTGINNDARTEIEVVKTETGEPLELPAIPAADITGVNFSRSGKTMAFYVNGDTSPSNLYTMDLASGKHKKLTDSMNPKINEKHLVNAEVVRFESFDGLEVPSLLYKPKNASADNPAPAMLYIHGGPGGQTRIGYNPVIQALTNHGYAVFAVNNRGSSGYGKTFFHLDDRKHGEDDLMDCVYGKRWLAEQDWIDPDRIGIMGGSYGGYMTVAAVTYHPDEFAVAIDIFGVTNWLRTLESIPSWWAAFRESLYAEMGDPAEDRERLHRISPLFHAENIRTPLMVIQGANDPRVLQVESDEMVEAARENGVPVEYIVFPDEGHGFRSKANRITALEGYLSFLDRYLTPQPTMD